jgi:hypothetical protein
MLRMATLKVPRADPHPSPSDDIIVEKNISFIKLIKLIIERVNIIGRRIETESPF